jgi:hypothetical protein
MSLHLDDGSRDNFAGQSHELTDLTGLLNRDVNDVQEPTPETETRSEQGASSTTKRFTGWRVGASYFALGALISLMLHIILAIWIPTLDSFHNGISVLWTGNCQTAGTYNTILRAGTTAIATLLIGESNYCMQCLTAPARKDLQTAHNKGIWLDVGVQSIRNLKIIKEYKAVLWLLVVISSIPIHLL